MLVIPGIKESTIDEADAGPAESFRLSLYVLEIYAWRNVAEGNNSLFKYTILLDDVKLNSPSVSLRSAGWGIIFTCEN